MATCLLFPLSSSNTWRFKWQTQIIDVFKEEGIFEGWGVCLNKILDKIGLVIIAKYACRLS